MNLTSRKSLLSARAWGWDLVFVSLLAASFFWFDLGTTGSYQWLAAAFFIYWTADDWKTLWQTTVSFKHSHSKLVPVCVAIGVLAVFGLLVGLCLIDLPYGIGLMVALGIWMLVNLASTRVLMRSRLHMPQPI